MIRAGILLFDGVEELDAVGPWEVFSWAALEEKTDPTFEAFTLSADGAPVTCNKGMVITPTHSFDSAPKIDVLLVPGGNGTRQLIEDRKLLDWVAATAAGCRWVTSVCTGSRVLIKSGVAKGKRVTTHHQAIDELAAWGEVQLVSGVRFVRDGNIVTSAGVSAGIDMALWLIGDLYGPAFARRVQSGIEYHPAPPYAFEA